MCFFKSSCQMRITPFSGAPILNAAVHCMCAWHVPAYAEAQCCFKSFALISCKCGRKNRFWLEFWSLDLLSAQVHFLGRVLALLFWYYAILIVYILREGLSCFRKQDYSVDLLLISHTWFMKGYATQATWEQHPARLTVSGFSFITVWVIAGS